jgi:flavin reductase (DIM6/NTAB) family NADH-FMN oxidoreductase RutF
VAVALQPSAHETTVTPCGSHLAFRQCLGASFPTGVAVVTAGHQGVQVGMTINSFTSVSLDPPLVLICLAEGTRTLGGVLCDRRFALSFLDRTQHEVALAFAANGAPFPRRHVSYDEHGFVVVNNALAVLRCRAREAIRAGDHRLVLADVIDFESRGGDPLVFHRGSFVTVNPPHPSLEESP